MKSLLLSASLLLGLSAFALPTVDMVKMEDGNLKVEACGYKTFVESKDGSKTRRQVKMKKKVGSKDVVCASSPVSNGMCAKFTVGKNSKCHPKNVSSGESVFLAGGSGVSRLKVDLPREEKKPEVNDCIVREDGVEGYRVRVRGVKKGNDVKFKISGFDKVTASWSPTHGAYQYTFRANKGWKYILNEYVSVYVNGEKLPGNWKITGKDRGESCK